MSAREAFGPNLRRARLSRGITLQQIADLTNVAVDVWSALERNDFSEWPTGLFARAYIRQYANAIGVDAEATVDEFCRWFPQGDRRAERIVRGQARIVGHQLEWTGDPLPDRHDRRAGSRARPGAPDEGMARARASIARVTLACGAAGAPLFVGGRRPFRRACALHHRCRPDELVRACSLVHALLARRATADTSRDHQGCRVLQAFGVTDQGRIRPSNEDYFVIDENAGLCVVADGMGGHNAGEVAARIAVQAIVEYIRASVGRAPDRDRDETWPYGFNPSLSDAGNLLRTAIHLANAQVLEAAVTDDEYAGMGTTIVAALVTGDRLSVGHVGDSRLYIADRMRLRQLTDDDSWVATVLAQNPSVDPMVLQQHPMRNALTNVVGGRPAADVHVREERLTGGELLVLSTDGVHGVLDEQRIRELLLDGGDPRGMATALVSAALARGSRDNCTAVVARYLA